MIDWFLRLPGSFFIYAVSTLYALQAVQYWAHGKYAPAALVFLYALAGIPLILMTRN